MKRDDYRFLADKDFWEGWWSVLACSLVAEESDSWCPHPTALWTGEGLGWRWSRCCSHFPPSALFLCSFMSLCLELATGFSHWWAHTVSVGGLLLPWHGLVSPVQVVSTVGFCNAFSEHHDRAFFLLARWRRLLWARVHLPSLWRGQPSATAPEARWTLRYAGWLSWGLLRLTRSLAIWCQGWEPKQP